MSNPHVTLDPDPLHVGELENAAFLAGYDAAAEDDRRARLVGLVLAALSGAVVGAALMYGIVSAASRPAHASEGRALRDGGPTGAPLTLPSSDEPRSGGPVVQAGSGNPLAPSPSSPMPDGSSITGIASWYDAGPGLYAAVPTWRWGDEPYRVRVTAGHRSVVVTVLDFCGCPGGRVIDLSADAFARLAPLSAGLVRVTITRLGPGLTPPPTTTGDGS